MAKKQVGKKSLEVFAAPRRPREKFDSAYLECYSQNMAGKFDTAYYLNLRFGMDPLTGRLRPTSISLLVNCTEKNFVLGPTD